MRKAFQSALILLAVMAASCSRVESDDVSAMKELTAKTFTAYGEGDMTKAFVGDDNAIYWQDIDTINVFDINESPTQDAMFSIESSTSTTTKADLPDNDDNVGSSESGESGFSTKATFVGNIPESLYGYYAVYPYRNYKDYSDEKVYGLYDSDADRKPETLRLEWAGHNQNPVEGSFEAAKALMVAMTSGTSLEFKNVFSFLKFTVDFPCDYITISANGGEHLTAQDIIVQMEDGVPVIRDHTLDNGSDGSAVVRCKADDEYIAPGTYYVAVMPQTLSKGLTITFRNPNGVGDVADASKSTEKEISLVRSHVLNMGTFSSDFLNTTIDGEGTEDKPFLIYTVNQLNHVASKIKAGNETFQKGYYRLMNDLNFLGRQIAPIGYNGETAFMGNFDGNGKTISNYIPGYSCFSSGLFAYAKKATVKNLTVRPSGIKEAPNSTKYNTYSALVGTVCCDNASEDTVIIDNCKVEASNDEVMTLPAGDYTIYFGAIVGRVGSSLRVTNCVTTLPVVIDTYENYMVRGEYVLGGIAGGVNNYNGDLHVYIDRCRSLGDLTIKKGIGHNYVGGIVGLLCDDGDVMPVISNCTHQSDLTVNSDGTENDGNDTMVGGIVGKMDTDGYHDEDPYILNCLNAGSIFGHQSDPYLGGIMGWCYDDDTRVHNCASLTTSIHSCDDNDADRGALCGTCDGRYFNCHWLTLQPTNLPIVYDSSDDTYSYRDGCSRVETVTADMMNEHLADIPNTWGLTFCRWTGSSSDNSLSLLY